jgi:hypothetical protein
MFVRLSMLIYNTFLFFRQQLFSIASEQQGLYSLYVVVFSRRGLNHGPLEAAWQRTRQDESPPHHMLFRATFDGSRLEHYSSAGFTITLA